MKIDWKRKFSSRKFWAAFAVFITSLMIFYNVDRETVESVVSLIGTFGSLVIYILVEGAVDAAGADVQLVEYMPEGQVSNNEPEEKPPNAQ